MTTARTRQRPGAAAPFPLIPHVEAIVPTSATTPEPDTPAVVPAAHTPQAPTAAPVAAPADPKVARTFQLHTSVLAEAQTAVLRTAGVAGGYSSLNALAEGAIIRELQRLADEFNGGEAFPPHTGKFRAGRPIGS
ncbi:hypothetical protein OVA26_17185 [Microbacterium sp. SL62]|uniref:hypothetical protein n=1 Tax=Microbacterium sp. SL62 TaxID=2995139 RepID=UPI002276419C|nr:hypothetical protein [Microbacterium sp. SL62]MCY1718673.1 hypothetical protein [Microbacterium sp. SL62]